jgi:HD-GYP domain-containing protein (c-di-GMP phosphodiesterase class II)
MTASRSYSEPMPAEAAVAEIRRLAGAQFSAAAVAAFERLVAAADKFV